MKAIILSDEEITALRWSILYNMDVMEKIWNIQNN